MLTPVQHSQIGDLIPIETDIEQIGTESPEGIDDEAIEMPTDVAAVLTTVENKNKEEQNQLSERIAVLTRQKDNLKMRLKKYVSAVQMLKSDGDSAHKVLADLSFSEDSGNEENDHVDEAKIYEEKLVQVIYIILSILRFY